MKVMASYWLDGYLAAVSLAGVIGLQNIVQVEEDVSQPSEEHLPMFTV